MARWEAWLCWLWLVAQKVPQSHSCPRPSRAGSIATRPRNPGACQPLSWEGGQRLALPPPCPLVLSQCLQFLAGASRRHSLAWQCGRGGQGAERPADVSAAAQWLQRQARGCNQLRWGLLKSRLPSSRKGDFGQTHRGKIPPANQGRGPGADPSLVPFKRNQPCPWLDRGLPDSRTPVQTEIVPSCENQTWQSK
ncbi:uncharacterized protein LOC113600513 isoform X2 [Acinonyx jubatus]|uniref:Uncharacterized protein LOC113600513 isoform X2 n=1 Tax=Acinonyx jubatus TaxID=32536 RepID=A0ABM3NXB4_ACIJB|nr:uncharacterized protein LOC113600513 isoform X2 [Acinonyx jubatus]